MSSRPQGLYTSSIGLEAPLISPGSPHHTRAGAQRRGVEGDVPLNVLIPMGGLKNNSVVPPPLRNIVGRPIIFWLLDHLTLSPNDSVWIGLPKEVDEYFALSKQVANEFPHLNVHVVPLLFPTSGPIETIFIMLQAMGPEDLGRKTISLDSATLYFSDVLAAFRQVRPSHGASFYFVQHDSSSPTSLPGQRSSSSSGGGEDDASDSAFAAVAAAAAAGDASPPGSSSASKKSEGVAGGGGAFSYIQLSGGIITDIREKVAISAFANTGAYGFPSAACLRDTCEKILDQAYGGGGSNEDDDEALPVLLPGRTYVSNAIKTLMDSGEVNFVGIHVPSFACVARPDQLDDFLFHVKEGTAPLVQRRIRFCFDLDGTLVTHPKSSSSSSSLSSSLSRALDAGAWSPSSGAAGGVAGARTPGNAMTDPGNSTGGGGVAAIDWSAVEPIEKNVELVRQLKRAGHHVIIQTSRGMRAHQGNVGAVMAEIGAATFKCLSDFDIPYDEIIFGKPEADVYVGHKHVSSMLDTGAEIGWFVDKDQGVRNGLDGAVAPRDFNTVRPVDDTHVFKTGPLDIMRGEVHWYKSIPPPLVDLFPAVRSVDEDTAASVSLVMAKVDGTTFTQLLVSSAVTEGRLRLLLRGIARMHFCDYTTPSAASAASAAAAAAAAGSEGSTQDNEEEGDDGSSGVGGGGLEGGEKKEEEDDEDLPTADELSQNYAPKVSGRYKKHRDLYLSFAAQVPEVEDMQAAVVSFLVGYAREERFKVSRFIHGDPVFSNVLLEKTSAAAAAAAAASSASMRSPRVEGGRSHSSDSATAVRTQQPPPPPSSSSSATSSPKATSRAKQRTASSPLSSSSTSSSATSSPRTAAAAAAAASGADGAAASPAKAGTVPALALPGSVQRVLGGAASSIKTMNQNRSQLASPWSPVKFIDMRGALGGRLTTAGDMLYDLSKMYQSLCGYDFMLLDLWEGMPDQQHANLHKLREVFWDCVKRTYCSAPTPGSSSWLAGSGVSLEAEEAGEGTAAAGAAVVDEDAFAVLKRDVTLLTASHYFTIVPLHETRPRQLRYLQQCRKMLREEGLL